MSEMLNFGNGDHTGARLYHHVTRLLHTFEMLGGLQQCHLGPDPEPAIKLDEMWHDYDMDARQMLQDLSHDLGYDVLLTPTFAPCRKVAPRRNAMPAKQPARRR